MSGRRTDLSLVAHQAGYELRALRRDRQAAVTTVLMPIALLVAFVGLAGHGATVVEGGRRESVAQFYVPGLIAFAIVGAAFGGLLVELVTLRQAGVLKRRRATPVPAWGLIAGRAAAAGVVAVATTCLLLVMGRNNYDVHVRSAAVPAIVVTVLLGTAAFCCFAYALAPFVRNPGAVQPVIQIVLLPLYVISGVLLPDSKNPHVLQVVARAFPLEHIANGLHRAFAAPSPGIGLTPADVGILVLWIAAGTLVAVRCFRWLPG